MVKFTITRAHLKAENNSQALNIVRLNFASLHVDFEKCFVIVLAAPMKYFMKLVIKVKIIHVPWEMK